MEKKVNTYWYKYQFAADEEQDVSRSEIGARIRELIKKSESVESSFWLKRILISILFLLAAIVLNYLISVPALIYGCALLYPFYLLYSSMRIRTIFEEDISMSIYRSEIYLLYQEQKRYGVRMGELLERMLYHYAN